MKKFFNISENKYIFEINDIRAILSMVNLYFIIKYNLSIVYICAVVAIFGIIKDFTTDRHINGFIIHIISLIIVLYNFILK